jgi:hypothetical protein
MLSAAVLNGDEQAKYPPESTAHSKETGSSDAEKVKIPTRLLDELGGVDTREVSGGVVSTNHV